jgi:hypothetical protein
MSSSDHVGRWEYRCILCGKDIVEFHGRSGKKVKRAICVPCTREAVMNMTSGKDDDDGQEEKKEADTDRAGKKTNR